MEAAIIAGVISLVVTLIGKSLDQTRQTAYQNAQNEFNSEEAAINREFWSEPERFNRMTSELGFNPDLVAQSIMGSSGGNTYAASAASPLGNEGSLGSLLGGLMGGTSERMFESALQDAQVKNLNANTDFTNTQNFWFPIDTQTRIDEMKSLKEKYLADGRLSDSMSKYYDEETRFIEPKAVAEIAKDMGVFHEAMAEASYFWKQQEVQDALKSLYASESALNYQQIRESVQREYMYQKQGDYYEDAGDLAMQNVENLKSENIFLKARNAFVEKMNGFPFSVDFKDMLFYMSATEEGNTEAKDFMDAVAEGESILYDHQVQNQMDNYWKNLLISLGHAPESFSEGFGNGLGWSLGAGGKSVRNMKENRAASKPDASKAVGKSVPENGMKYNGVVVAPNGQKYKTWTKSDGKLYYEKYDD